MRAYKAKCGATQFMPSYKEAVEAADDYEGFCLACGHRQGGQEPDSRRDPCEECGKPKVYGAEQLVLMGLVYH